MEDSLSLAYTDLSYAESFCSAVDTVAKERKYLASTSGFPLETTESFVKSIIDNNYAQYFAILDDNVVGWCDVIPKPFEGLNHVATLGMGVLSEYRGKGIGKQLLEIAIHHAHTKNDIEKVELEVFSSNTSAVELYKKYGFVIEGKRVNARKLDGQYDDILLMGKFI